MRRGTLRTALLLTAAALISALAPAQTRYEANWASLDKRPTPAWFQDDKFGIFIHWGVYSVPSYAPVGQYAEWYWNHLARGPQDKEGKPNPTWDFHKRVYGENFPYANFAPMFRAELYDPGHWAEVFEKSGAKYVVLTSKHHDGYALWPSEHASLTWGRPWNSVAVGPQRDLMGDLAKATRERGLRFGFYYSLYEWYNPLWLKDRKRYVNDHMIPQFKDVVQRYEPAIIFSDGEWDMPSSEWRSEEMLAWLFNESSVKDHVVVNDRWGKETRHVHGGYYTTEYTAGLQDAKNPWEESRGMAHSYGYNRAERLNDYRTNRELLLMLVDLVSRGGNLLLDIGPTGDGRIPVIQEERLLQIGDWLRVNGEAIYGTKPWKRTRQFSAGQIPELKSGQYMIRYEVTDYVDRKKPGQAVIEAFFTAKGDALYAIMPGWPGRTLRLKDVVLREDSKVELLGQSGTLNYRRMGKDLEVELPELSPDAAKAQYLYVVKLSAVN
jgi:alpha-L-fucosidase